MTRARRQLSVLYFAAATSAAALGCGLNQEGVRPLADTIGYPASAVIDPTGEWMFVANSNADLRYNDGTLVAVRLALAAEDRRNRGVTVDGTFMGGVTVGGTFVPAETCPSVNYVRPLGQLPDFCCIDPLDPYVLNCDERRYVKKEATVRIGSFAAGMVRQDPPCKVNPDNACQTCDPSAADQFMTRLLIAVRGDTSLTYVDVRPEKTDDNGMVTQELALDCVGGADGDNGEEFATCDKGHRVVDTQSALAVASGDADPPLVPFPDEPYTLTVDEDLGLLYVGHLAGLVNRPGSGGVSLFDVAAVNEAMPAPRFIATFTGIFAANATGQVGVTSLRWEKGRAVYATSRYLPLVTGLAATTPIGCQKGKDQEPIREIAIFGSGESYATTLTGSETRGIQFVNDHAFVLQRVPPAVVDFYQGNASQFIEVCQSPTFLQKNPAGDRLFVTCFDSGEIYVIDPFIPRVERIFPVGRGPAGLVFPDNDPTVAYVVGFSDNSIGVVDMAPGSPSRYHLIQRIGFPNTVPR